MNITEVTRSASDTIRFLLDGKESFAAVDHPIIKEWEAAGNTIPPYVPPPAPPPAPLTARQLRLGLVTNGFALEQVEAAIADIDEPQQRAIASIEWQYASQFERSHPLIAQVGASLGLANEQIDGMWASALIL